MTRITTIAAAALALALAACDMDVPDLNNPSIDDLLEDPTPAEVAAASTGMLIGNRLDHAEANGYISILGILGRESYNFDNADPRYITELLAAAQLDPGSGRFGGNFWVVPYANIRNAHLVLAAVDIVVGMTDEQKEAVRGFAKTILAIDFLTIINTHDVNGAVIDVDRPIDAELAPIESKEAVFAHIADLLDEAVVHLEAGGDAFPFALSSGFDGFDTPETFIQFNRALMARVELYRGNYQAALDALEGSFITADPDDPQLDLGVYHVYGTGSGDRLNGLVDPNLYAHPAIAADAEEKPNGTGLDDRVTRKLVEVEPRTVQGLTSSHQFAMYPTPTSRAPIIRNEELILIRAEANIGLGEIEAATADIDFIRVESGGLAPRGTLTEEEAVDELLKQRRYSLLFEGGHRWIDMRRHGRLDELPIDVEGHTVHAAFPIPVQETDARE